MGKRKGTVRGVVTPKRRGSSLAVDPSRNRRKTSMCLDDDKGRQPRRREGEGMGFGHVFFV